MSIQSEREIVLRRMQEIETEAREIVLRRMQEIETEAWVAMMNHPKLAKHLPLLRTPFTLEDAKEFVLIKESYW